MASPSLQAQSAPATAVDTESLLNWAERAYPQYFPGSEITRDAPPYRYRHYPATGNYVGVAGPEVFVLGPLSGGVVTKVGVLGDFECPVLARGCPVPTESRLSAQQGLVVARETSGRLVVWGSNNYLLSSDGEPVPGSTTRVVANGGRGFLVNDSGGLWIDDDGKTQIWGSWTETNASFKDRLAGPWAGRVRLASSSQANSFVAVLEDGTAWLYPGTSETVNGTTRRVPARIGSPAGGVAAIGRQFDFFTNRVHYVLEDGTVTVTDGSLRDTLQSLPIRDVADVVSAGCTRDRCAGLRRDGTVIEWGIPAGDVRVVAGLTNIKQITIGTSSLWSGGSASLIARAAAIDGHGQLWIGRGQAPEPAAGFDNVTDVSCHVSYCVVRRADGTVWGWGSGFFTSVQKVLGPGATDGQIARVPGVLIP